MEEFNELASPYISPFLDSTTKNGKELLKAIHQHENHQAPLTSQESFVEGKTFAYSMKDKQFYGRR